MPSSALSMPATASTSSTACARVRHGFYQGLCPICGASSTYRRCPFAIGPLGAYYTHLRNDAFPIAGWSSLVARWAHNPEVVGSNPAPATKNFKLGGQTASEFFVWVLDRCCTGAPGFEATLLIDITGEQVCTPVGRHMEETHKGDGACRLFDGVNGDVAL